MKTVRQVAILDIIEKQDIETQEELAEALQSARHRSVTQATVSRDIKELRLLKVLSDQRRAISMPRRSKRGAGPVRSALFAYCLNRSSVLSIASANNLIVIKTLSGSANVAAEAHATAMHWPRGAGHAGRRQHHFNDYSQQRGSAGNYFPGAGADEVRLRPCC